MAHKVTILSKHSSNPDGSQRALETPVFAMIQVDSIGGPNGIETVLSSELGLDKLNTINVVSAQAIGWYNSLPAVTTMGTAVFSNGKFYPADAAMGAQFNLTFNVQRTDTSGVDTRNLQSLVSPAFALVIAT